MRTHILNIRSNDQDLSILLGDVHGDRTSLIGRADIGGVAFIFAAAKAELGTDGKPLPAKHDPADDVIESLGMRAVPRNLVRVESYPYWLSIFRADP